MGSVEWEEQQRDNFYGYKVENRDGFDMLSITKCGYNEDTTFLTGIKNEKHWIGMFDEQTKKQLREWNGTETIEREMKIDLGYGETYTLDVSCFGLYLFEKTAWGFVAVPKYTHREPYVSVAGGEISKDILLLNGNKLIVYPLNNPGIVQPHWFQESIVVSSYEYGGEGTDYTVLSPDGKKVAEWNSGIFDVKSDAFPVSYIEGIFLNHEYSYDIDLIYTDYWVILRHNYLTEKDVWKTSIPSLKDLKNDARISTTVLEQGNPIWKYRIDVTNRDGSKQQVLFTVNVETGALTEI